MLPHYLFVLFLMIKIKTCERIMQVCVSVWQCVPHHVQVPAESRRGRWIP